MAEAGNDIVSRFEENDEALIPEVPTVMAEQPDTVL
jgi:hypothetical protein